MFVSVKGKVVLILGGSSGIGKALANRFCKEGAAVVATYFSTKTNEVAEMLEDNFRYCDIRHPSELNSVCEYIMKLIAFVGMDCNYGPDVFFGQNTPVVFSHALVVQLCDQSASRVDTQISHDELSLFFKEKSDRPFPNLQQRYL